MNAQLSRTTRVFISLFHEGQRYWLTDVANDRNNLGHIYLKGDWNTDASRAKGYTFEIATVIRRRLSEQEVPTQISLVAGDLADFIDEEKIDAK